MKIKKLALAALSVGAAAALSFTSAGAATASPAGHPKPHKPKPASYPQVSGYRLASALLPTSAFGDRFQVWIRQSTGNRLGSAHAAITPGSMSCKNFETYSIIGGWGDTAGAQDGVFNTSPDISGYPSLVLDAFQNVVQFASPRAAATFYNQEYAKYQACPSLSLSLPDSLGGGTEDLANQSLARTTLGKFQAFNLIQSDIQSNFAANSWYRSTLVVLAGTNVYTIFETNGTNDPVSPDLMTKLISRTQALYPRH
jgi:hypothetical protein